MVWIKLLGWGFPLWMILIRLQTLITCEQSWGTERSKTISVENKEDAFLHNIQRPWRCATHAHTPGDWGHTQCVRARFSSAVINGTPPVSSAFSPGWGMELPQQHPCFLPTPPTTQGLEGKENGRIAFNLTAHAQRIRPLAIINGLCTLHSSAVSSHSSRWSTLLQALAIFKRPGSSCWSPKAYFWGIIEWPFADATISLVYVKGSYQHV